MKADTNHIAQSVHDSSHSSHAAVSCDTQIVEIPAKKKRDLNKTVFTMLIEN